MSDLLAPQAPIALFEGRSYQGLFGSLDELLVSVEAIDVRNEEFSVFDALGREIVLAAESDSSEMRGEISSADPDPDRLRAQLADAVREIGAMRMGLIDADLGLPELLRAIWRFGHPRRPFPG